MASRRLYTSSNGDFWDLIREGDAVRVRHQANLASGGATTDHELIAFIARDGHSPQANELVKLIGTLVGDAQSAGEKTNAL